MTISIKEFSISPAKAGLSILAAAASLSGIVNCGGTGDSQAQPSESPTSLFQDQFTNYTLLCEFATKFISSSKACGEIGKDWCSDSSDVSLYIPPPADGGNQEFSDLILQKKCLFDCWWLAQCYPHPISCSVRIKVDPKTGSVLSLEENYTPNEPLCETQF